jgi:hypothetical protein
MKITGGPFSGERPRLASHLLGDTEAQLAQNCYLEDGNAGGLTAPLLVKDLTGTTYETILEYTANSVTNWLVSQYDLNCFRSPIALDAYERLYITGYTLPCVIANDILSTPFDPTTSNYLWGVPRPTSAPTVPTGGANTLYYAYTYENAYGEEGPPSAIAGGDTVHNLPVAISGLPSAPPANRRIIYLNLYRTTSGSTGIGSFNYVLTATWFDITVSYAVGDFVIYSNALYKCTSTHSAGAWNGAHFTAGDDVTALVVSGNEVCPSVSWYPPPTTLKNVVMLSNGIAVGSSGNTLCFSEPYLPHAWPPEYQVPIDETIVALGFFGNSVVVATNGYPRMYSGDDPSQMSPTIFGSNLPCLSKRGSVSDENSFMYPSTSGLVKIDYNGPIVITGADKMGFVTMREWATFYPDAMHAAFYDGKYIAFSAQSSKSVGIIVDFKNNLFIRLSVYAQALYVSPNDDNLYVIMDSTSTASPTPQCIKQWEGDPYNYLQFTWRSKRYVLPVGINLAYARVTVDETLNQAVLDLMETNDHLATQNAADFAAAVAIITGDHATFTGTAGDKIKVILDGTTFDNIAIGTLTTITQVASAINTALSKTVATVTTLGYLKIQGVYHAEIADGSTTSQTVVAKLFTTAGIRKATAVSIGGGIGEDSLGTYGVGCSEIMSVSDITVSDTIIFNLYADDTLIFAKTVKDQQVFSLPAGYITRNYYYQIAGISPVRMVEMATSLPELQR